MRTNMGAVREMVAKGWDHTRRQEIPMLLLNIPHLVPTVKKDPSAASGMGNWRWGRVALAVVLFGLAFALSLNWLFLLYHWMVQQTTAGTTWTCIMRAHPWVLPLFTVPTYAAMVGGMWKRMGREFNDAVENTDANLRPFVTALIIVTLAIAMGIGIIFGHVYWGGSC